jgi:RNA polymerase sigma factor (sigma-70 family)
MDSYEIYDQYYQRVKRFIFSYVRDEWTADDLSQETFIRIQNSIDTVKDTSKLFSWIFRVAYNLCQDHFRSRKVVSSRECELSESMEGFMEAMVQKKLEQCEMGSVSKAS